MNLEKRVELLEQAVKALEGGVFTVKNGEIFINEAFIQSGSITAARIETAMIPNAQSIIDNALDNYAISLRDSQHLSHL